MEKILIQTHGEKFTNITSEIQCWLKNHTKNPDDQYKIIHLFCPHTSCALCLMEAFESSAVEDVQNFLKFLAPRNLKFIQHTTEGQDDSPSHMKTILLQSSLMIPLENNQLFLGRYQGLFLAEFRDQPRTREIILQTL